MVLLRGLSDLLMDIDFMHVQLRVLQETGPSHRSLNVQMRIAELHRRLDEVEQRLRFWASQVAKDDGLSISQSPSQLAGAAERTPGCTGIDRRRSRTRSRTRRHGYML